MGISRNCSVTGCLSILAIPTPMKMILNEQYVLG
jgi:hypothetical protein